MLEINIPHIRLSRNAKKTTGKNRNSKFKYSAFHDQTKSRNVKFQDFVRLSERSVHKFTISITISIFFYNSALKIIFRQSVVGVCRFFYVIEIHV